LEIFLLAGEPSGDVLGARVMASLREMAGDRPLRFIGVGGERMVAEGLERLFPLDELALFGLAELLPKLPRLIRRLNQTVAAICSSRPAAVVTIDSPSFSLRVARRVRRRLGANSGVPLIHFVAPTVWAWRPERARQVAGFLDHMLVLFPFEPPYFLKEGLACTYVGHPIVESPAGHGDGSGFRRRHGIESAARLLVVLPGSRTTEVRKLMGDFGRTVALLALRYPDLTVVIPTVPQVAAMVRAGIADWTVPTVVVEGDAEKYDAFAAAEVALAASGTVALELALARLPAVIAYRLNPLTVALYRRLIKVKYVNLVNLMLDRPLVPELLQENCTPDRLAAAVVNLLDNPELRREQIDGLVGVDQWLGEGGIPPSRRAAEVIWTIATEPAKP
jgi:lipid-A-disaccharide synthase